MVWRPRIVRLLVVVSLCHVTLAAPNLVAQDASDFLSDLTELDDETTSDELPPPETIPLVPESEEPQIDLSTDADAFSDSEAQTDDSSGTSEAEAVGSRDRSDPDVSNPFVDEQNASDQQAADSPLGLEPIPAQADADGLLDEENAEILPQEIVRERYADGTVKIKRGVTQDEQQNYVNHGPWEWRDRQGQLLAEGAYRFGERQGKWSRLYQADEARLFSLPPFNQFNGPFLSEANFQNGQLDGQWVIYDAEQNKICQWSFAAGRRDGESTWYYHTRRPMRVIHYAAGQLHGPMREWDVNSKLLTDVHYIQGRRHEKMVETFSDGQKKLEGMVLRARLVMKTPDDWWDAKLATYVTEGKDQKHGWWKAWYANGQQKFEGQYQEDQPVGQFTWWYENGQKSLQGFYELGQKEREWTWWHPNGIKSIQGQYRSGSPVEQWIWWNESGKVAQRIDFSK